MAKYKRRPDTLFPFEANRYEEASQLPPGAFRGDDGCVYVKTIQGRDVQVSVGEWVLQDVDGVHHYPCQDEVFKQRYEPAEGD